jgi:undecaprenyl-phosphate 4-deoxy-4-formamido-L-arabinose transferase
MTRVLERAASGAPQQLSRTGRVRLSIVIPVYRGEKTIGRLVSALVDCLDDRCHLEIVLVNDGSPDNSADICRAIAGTFPFIKFLNLSRNFSEHNAVMAGLNHATGDYVVIMDDDFQNPPGEVMKLVDEIQKGYDVVFSCYAAKKHHVLRNLGSKINDWFAVILLLRPATPPPTAEMPPPLIETLRAKRLSVRLTAELIE